MKYGYKPSIVKDESHIFGVASSPPFPVVQPSGDWSEYLVVKEFQNLNGIEPYACVIFTMLNCIEILIKKKYGIEINLADRFLAFCVDTRSQGGCSPDVACEFLRKIGVPPQDVWPFDTTIDTSDKFFTKPEQKIFDIAKEFIEEWDFKHKFVPSNHDSITAALTCSPLLFSVAGWFVNADRIYYRPDNMGDNHATTLFYQRIGQFRRVFDSYDNPALKDYRWSDLPQEVKVFFIEKKVKATKENWLVQFLKSLVLSIKAKPKVPDPVVKDLSFMVLERVTVEKSPREKLYDVAVSCLGIDASPNDVAPDELGCAESVNEVVFKAFGEYIETPGLSTTKLFAAMVDRADKYVRVLDPEPGNIIISPTGFSTLANTPIKNGHVGIFGKNQIIMSNSSSLGTFIENYTLDTWIERYRKQGGYPIFIFKRIAS